MKKLISSLVLLAQISAVAFPVGARAEDENEKAIREAHRLMRDEYPALLRQSFLRQIDGYLAKRAIDILLSSAHLYNRARMISDEIGIAETKLLPAIEADLGRGTPVEWAAVKTKILSLRAKNLTAETVAIGADLSLLKQAWLKRCDAETLEFAYSYFTPGTKFHPSTHDLAPRTGEFSYYFQVSLGSEAGISFSSAHKGAAVGSVLSSNAYVLLTKGGALTGGAIGAAVGFVIGTLISLFEANLFDELRDLVHETRRLGDDIVAKEAARAKISVNEQCALLLRDEGAEGKLVQYTAAVAELARRAREFSHHSNQVFNEQLRLADQAQTRAVEMALVKLRANFREQLDVATAKRRAKDQEARSYGAGLEQQVKALKSPGGRNADKTTLADEVWTALIEGDRRYSNGSAPSFLLNKSERSEEYWPNFVRAMKGELINE